jgi:hypothetical protein
MDRNKDALGDCLELDNETLGNCSELNKKGKSLNLK